jgi:threonine/homoserine/homoserine lactone efflux protein
MPLALDTSVLWTFTLLWLVAVPTPGANSLMVTHVAMTRPAGHVALAILGNMLGILALAAGALLGWAALLETLPWLRLVVHVLGGAYLVYFGLRLIARSRGAATSKPAPGAVTAEADHTWRGTLALGFFTAVSNAQAILFITGVYAVTGVLRANVATGLATIVIMIVCNASYLAMLGWLFQRDAVQTFYMRFRWVLEATFGALFVIFGGRLLMKELVR